MRIWQISHNSLYTRGGGAQGGGGSRSASARTESGSAAGRVCARPTGTMISSAIIRATIIYATTIILERCYGTTRITVIPTAGRPSLHAVSEKSLRPRDPGEGLRSARSARTGVRAHRVAVLSDASEHPLQTRYKAARTLSVGHFIGRTGLAGGRRGRPYGDAVVTSTARRAHTRASVRLVGSSRATSAACAID